MGAGSRDFLEFQGFQGPSYGDSLSDPPAPQTYPMAGTLQGGLIQLEPRVVAWGWEADAVVSVPLSISSLSVHSQEGGLQGTGPSPAAAQNPEASSSGGTQGNPP